MTSYGYSSTHTIYPPDELFHFRPVSCEDVRRIILSLPSNKSPGPDKVHTRVLKDSLPVILGPLTDIINCSLQTSTFPDTWKEAEVIPLLKDGDHEVAANNRPLSLLAVASKVCEKIVLGQFSSYLTNNQRLSCHQSGNKKHHSTETLNIYITDTMLEAMDKKQLTALILLDLSKAFDSISHSILLHKLSNIGASPSTVNWFRSYLSGRLQSVRIGSSLSDPLPITHGVPQGAILSPLLFCIYMNDLPCAPQTCHLESYVDDSKVYLSFPVKDAVLASKKLEKDLLQVASWCSENQLLINPDKTKFLLVGTRQLMNRLPSNLSLSFLGKTLEPTASAKDLGVVLDSHLTYDCHISNLTSSCMSKLCQINRVKNSFDTKTLVVIIKSLVFSKMLYCSSVWANTSAKNLKKLQQTQNFGCKIATNSRKFDHVSPLLRQLDWLPVKNQLYFKDSVMAFKCLNDIAPNYLSSKFCKRSEVHNRYTRNRELLNIPLCRTASGQRTFIYRATKIWNELDNHLKSLPLKQFKSQLRSKLSNQM